MVPEDQNRPGLAGRAAGGSAEVPLPPEWRERKRAWRRSLGARWLRWTILVVLLVMLVLLIWGERVFRLRSNLVLLVYRQDAPPAEVVLAGDQRIEPGQLRRGQLEDGGQVLLSRDGIKVSRLKLERRRDRALQHLAMTISTSEVNVFEFSPSHHGFGTSFFPSFELTTARERREAEGAIFAINANFHDPDGAPLGLVVRQRLVKNPKFPNWTGFFFVAGGKPYAGPASLYEPLAGEVEEAVQVYPSVMRDHHVFNYVDLAPTLHFRGDAVTYRALVGMKEGGNIVFVVSGNGGIMDVAEVAHIAKGLGVQHATLLDGGRALQYDFRVEGFRLEFSAFNNDIPFEGKLKPFDRIRSPVFIVVNGR